MIARLCLRWRGAVAVAVVTLLLAGCGGGQEKKPPPATPVRVAAAQRIDAPVTILASGMVEPVQSVAVTAQVSGSLLDVAFKEGDFVQAGQVLFHIDPRPLRAAVDQVRATLARDQAQYEAGRKDDERYQKLADMGYVSRSQADQMHATAQAQAATAAADQAALRSAQVSLGFATIRAPISGRTGSLLVRMGNNVSPGGAALVVINQISPVLVRFPVLSQDFPVLQRAVAAHPLRVLAAANDSTQTAESGQLQFLDNTIDSLTGTVTGKASFPNSGGRMWPGELVFLTVEVSVQHGVTAVPTVAVQTGQQGPFVYVVDAKNAAATRPVATGIQVNDMTVIQKGLNVGERVVTDGQSRLNPGSRVSIITTGSDTGTARLSNAAGDSSGAGQATNANGDIIAGRAGAPGSGDVTQGTNGSAAPANGAANGTGGTPSAAAGGAAGTAATPNLPPPIVPAQPNATTTTPTQTTAPSSSTPNPAATTTPTTRPPVATPTAPATGTRPPTATPSTGSRP
jgi:multidrug efflux system membrane fusion protein